MVIILDVGVNNGSECTSSDDNVIISVSSLSAETIDSLNSVLRAAK